MNKINNIGELLEAYCKRYSIDNISKAHDFFHLAAMNDECLQDLIDNPDRDISEDDIRFHQDAVGLGAEILSSIYQGALFNQNVKDIEKQIKGMIKESNKILGGHIDLYTNNGKSNDTNFCDGNKLRNRMRLAEVKIRIKEIENKTPIRRTESYNILTTEKVMHNYNRALSLKKTIKEIQGKGFHEMSDKEIEKLPISLFLENQKEVWQDRLDKAKTKNEENVQTI